MKKNWHTRIAEARDRGWFTQEDEEDSGNWPDCACGEQDERIERDSIGIPGDLDLKHLGELFQTAILDAGDADWAEAVLEKIEARAAMLIANPDISKDHA